MKPICRVLRKRGATKRVGGFCSIPSCSFFGAGPGYPTSKSKAESLAILKILNGTEEGGVQQRKPKIMKKGRLIEQLEEAGIIDKNLTIGAKHSRLKGLLNS